MCAYRHFSRISTRSCSFFFTLSNGGGSFRGIPDVVSDFHKSSGGERVRAGRTAPVVASGGNPLDFGSVSGSRLHGRAVSRPPRLAPFVRKPLLWL